MFRSASRAIRCSLPVLAFFLVGLCWVVSSPPGSGVDEFSHYIRVVGMAHGQLLGDDMPAGTPFGDLTGDQLERVNQEAGVFDLPAGMLPPLACNVFDPGAAYACDQFSPDLPGGPHPSYHAKYLPLSYVLPALFTLPADTMWRAQLLGRLGFLVQNTALFALAFAAIRRLRVRIGGVAAAAIVLCATPLLLFQSGTMAPNATEILADVAFVASFLVALRLRSSRWWWISVGAAIVACWSRDLGVVAVPVFGLACLLANPEGARWLWSRRRTRDVVAAVALVIAGVGAEAWQLALKASLHPTVEPPAQLWSDVSAIVGMLRNSVGLVGWQNIRIDGAIEAAWLIGWVAALAVLGRRVAPRIRWVCYGLAAVYVVLNLALLSGMREAGFGSQSRFTMMIPIVIVLLLVVEQDRPVTRHAVGFRIACVVAALGHLSALLLNAQHNATGITRAPMDFTHVAWAPSGGWKLTLALFALACVVVAALPQPRLEPAVEPVVER